MVESNWSKKIHPSKPVSDFPSAFDTQHGGNHYADLKISPLKFIDENDLGFTVGNVIKYVVRADKKGGKDDLKKALHYLRLALESKHGVRSKVEYSDDKEIT